MSIATLASHSALQILRGARDEGLRTVLIVEKRRLELYDEFRNLIDKYIIVENFSETLDVAQELLRENAIFVPHGSAVEYVGPERFRSLPVPMFGNRDLMIWEGDQKLKMRLLKDSGIPVPREYSLEEEIDRPVIVKLPGAKGGRFFFLATSREEVLKRLDEYVRNGVLRSREDALVQEYVIGVPMYFHYFYSPIFRRVEILGIDIRYETNIDGLRRAPPQIASMFEPSFVVVGNIPVVIREKMLQTVLDYGKKFVRKSIELLPPGAIGPFCLESIVKDDLSIIVFEFSGRIVAGTNIYVGSGSPYSWLYWNEPMYMGRRIAREIRIAAEMGVSCLELILT
ncbi:MAG: formate--phosphoribosylaminoimidazolecarboxamide ligase [Crenarchaeota archaeon]|nr:formate--phosphoribosylaminoimidazolecarboxamide ligase [Thermoproteota archaeon]